MCPHSNNSHIRPIKPAWSLQKTNILIIHLRQQIGLPSSRSLSHFFRLEIKVERSWAPSHTRLIISSDLWIVTTEPSLRSSQDIILKQQRTKIIRTSSVLHFYFYYFRTDWFKMQQPAETTQTAQQTSTEPLDPTGKSSILTSDFILCSQIKIPVKTETGYFTSCALNQPHCKTWCAKRLNKNNILLF